MSSVPAGAGVSSRLFRRAARRNRTLLALGIPADAQRRLEHKDVELRTTPFVASTLNFIFPIFALTCAPDSQSPQSTGYEFIISFIMDSQRRRMIAIKIENIVIRLQKVKGLLVL